MGIREKLEQHPKISLLVALLVIAMATGYAMHVVKGGSGKPQGNGKAFFTTDDGATLFVDDADKVPPFDHEGHKAVRAQVFTCDGGEHHWVQYLEMYSDDVKRSLESADSAEKTLPRQMRAGGAAMSALVKKPGATDWVSTADAATYEEVCRPVPPDGMGTGSAEPFLP